MSNWRALPAGRELDREIAERLGWQSRIVGVGGAVAWAEVPWYSTDVNAALSLWKSANVRFLLQFEAATKFWLAWYDEPEHPQGVADSAALAICRAWLAWKESQA